MTKAQLKKKINECLRDDKNHIQKYIDRAINSGCIDIEGAENNYLLAKIILSAVYKEMSRQYSPMDYNKQGKKDVENIYIHL